MFEEINVWFQESYTLLDLCLCCSPCLAHSTEIEVIKVTLLSDLKSVYSIIMCDD